MERCRGTKEVMRAGLERALRPIWVGGVAGWLDSWGLKRLGGVEGAVGGELLVCFLGKNVLVRGGRGEVAEDRSNLKSDPREHEREVGKAEAVVAAAEGGSMVGKWWCGGAEQAARWAWWPAKEAKGEGRKGGEEAC